VEQRTPPKSRRKAVLLWEALAAIIGRCGAKTAQHCVALCTSRKMRGFAGILSSIKHNSMGNPEALDVPKTC
jgi:hypothetical protein